MKALIINRGGTEKPPFPDDDKKVGKNMTVFQPVISLRNNFIPIAVSPIVRIGPKWITLENGKKFHTDNGEVEIHATTHWIRSFILPEQPGDRKLVSAYYQGYLELKYKMRDVSKIVIDAFASTNIRASDFESLKAALDQFYHTMEGQIKGYRESAPSVSYSLR